MIRSRLNSAATGTVGAPTSTCRRASVGDVMNDVVNVGSSGGTAAVEALAAVGVIDVEADMVGIATVFNPRRIAIAAARRTQ